MVHGTLIRSAILKGSSDRHSFISIPNTWRNLINTSDIRCLKIESSANSILVSWDGQTHEDEDTVLLNSRLIAVNDLSEGETVVLQQVPCPRPCFHVSVTVNSFEHWEQLLLNTDIAQNAFLSQIRILSLHQKVPIWLDGGAVIYLEVLRISQSSSRGLLVYNTAIQVEKPNQERQNYPVAISSTSSIGSSRMPPSINKIDSRLYNFIEIYKLVYPIIRGHRRDISYICTLCLRAVPSEGLLSSSPSLIQNLMKYHPSALLISKVHLANCVQYNLDHFIANIKKSKQESSQTECKEENKKEFLVTVIIWESVIKDSKIDNLDVINNILLRGFCVASDLLLRNSGINGNSITITSCSDCPFGKKKNVEMDAQIVRSSDRLSESDVIEIKSKFIELSQSFPVILNSSSLLTILAVEGEDPKDVYGSSRNQLPVFLDKHSVHSFSINCVAPSERIPQIPPLLINNMPILFRKNYIAINEPILNELIDHVLIDLNCKINFPTVSPQFALLQGSKCSGKTSLIEALKQKLSHSPYYITVEVMKLKEFKGKKVDALLKSLKQILNATNNRDSVLIILDDLDFYCPVPSPMDPEKGVIHDHLLQARSCLRNYLFQLSNICRMNTSHSSYKNHHNLITVIGTCVSRCSVHPELSNPKGKHIFPNSFLIPPAENKLYLLEKLVRNCLMDFNNENGIKLSESTNHKLFARYSNSVASQIDSFALSDLDSLSKRICIEANSRETQRIQSYLMSSEENVKQLNFEVTYNDFENALRNFVSLSSKSLSDGHHKTSFLMKAAGLGNVKTFLKEMILWPVKFPTLLAYSSLRLRSGILLYGPPGCGKSLVVKACLEEAKINSIVVKGPELLSKYIGQSEKSVRDVFERAQRASPCVIFFDEFDSLAPKRGHDNTGVTDRVVNQLLTQMDGVEGRSQVYVLAATSRPDLIDPALLRPGRLDKCVYCSFPNTEERLEILQVLSEHLSFEKNVNFLNFATQTEGFTGADLQSLLSTAQVKAAQTLIRNSLYSDIYREKSIITGKTRTVSNITNGNRKFSNITEQNRMIGSQEFVEINYEASTSCSTFSSDSATVVITDSYISEALKEIKPSISVNDRLRYREMHRKFQYSEDEKSGFGSFKPGTRETLA